MCAHVHRPAGQQAAPFVLAESSPGAEGFLEGRGVGAALCHDRALRADELGESLALASRVTPFPVGMEEQRIVLAAATR